jgi:general secretion pathway protein D
VVSFLKVEIIFRNGAILFKDFRFLALSIRNRGFRFILIALLLLSTSSVVAQDQAELEASADSSTEINVRNADIASIVRVFSKKTKRNYILDDRVKGKVSIYLPGKVSSQDSIRILDSVLAYKGFAAVPIGENLWKVIPAKEARQSTVPTVSDDELGTSASVVTKLVNLKNIAADEAKQALQQLISPDGFLNSYPGTNSLIIIDTEDNITRLMGILESIDIASSNRDMTIIPIENADATDIATKLKELLLSDQNETANDLLIRTNQNNRGVQTTNLAAGNNPVAEAAANAGNTVAASTRQPKIIADERTNSVVVVADEAATARIQALIEQLDSPVDMSGLKFYVYHCQHAKAEEIAEVLAGLVGEDGTGGAARPAQNSIAGNDGDLINTGGAGGAGRENNRNRTQNRLNGQTRTPGRSRNENRQQDTGTRSVQLGENFSISADSATNTLIIFANKSQFEKVRALLQALDVKRRQVLVEAMLLEVGINDEQRLKSSFIASGGGKDGGVIAQSFGSDILGLLSNPAGIEEFSVAAASAGTLTIGGKDSPLIIPSQTLLLSAIQRNTSVNVLSSPNILATNNEPAEIVVGQNIPFLASTSTDGSNLSNTFNQIDRQDVGITLRLTPQISSRDTVNLNIFTEVSSLISTDPTLGPTTAVRTSETSVIAKDGQMIVTGGLMSDENNNTDAGAPFLSDIPVLGHLFRFSNETRRRTNLLILITPRIVKDQFDARDLTIEGRNILEREIDIRDIHPNRKEILHRKSINRVAESVPYEGEAPSTILAPSEVKPLEAATPVAKEKTFEMDVNAEVKPKFQDKKEVKTKAASNLGKAPQSASYVVLKAQGKEFSDFATSLPFQIASEDASMGLLLSAEAKKTLSSKFSAGSLLGYKFEDKTIMFRVMGVFPASQDAKMAFPAASGQWYELSPYEIMNFGKGPWVNPK